MKCGYIKATLQDNFHYYENPKDDHGFKACVPEANCNTIFTFKSYKVDVKCGGFQMLMAQLGGLVFIIILVIAAAICIGIKYFRWK
mmetsp:Transcript_23987/g.36835  ORF Transcript_23987/g.36835 Transcript_23987/m.36835 type:complete len:86 (-) Transcript_23987:307-564(-)